VLVVNRALWLAQTNCYLVGAAEEGIGILIDAPPDPVGLEDLIEAAGIVPTALVLTHGHVDHMGGAGYLQRSRELTVYVHRDDDFLTLDPQTQLRALFGMLPAGDFSPPEELTDLGPRSLLELGGLNFEIRHTPGHTPGHCCFYLPEEGVLFSGDQLFAGSVGRTDLPGGDWEQLLASMASEVLPLDDQVRVLPGHGPETTIGQERRHNPFLSGLTAR
jgi:glyoxylase-like metal-dependent hydrolase (beta-lactamase superfamily II)